MASPNTSRNVRPVASAGESPIIADGPSESDLGGPLTNDKVSKPVALETAQTASSKGGSRGASAHGPHVLQTIEEGDELNVLDRIAEHEVEQEPVLPSVLRQIHNYISRDSDEAGKKLLENLPKVSNYTFDDAGDDKAPNEHEQMLFLGEEEGVQAWALLRTNQKKPDEVGLYVYETSTGEKKKFKSAFSGLPLMFPFKALQNKRDNTGRDLLVVLVRYIYREAGLADDPPFTVNAKTKFRSALCSIQANYDKQGGAENIPDTYPPSVVPSRKRSRNGVSPAHSSASDLSDDLERLRVDTEKLTVTLTPAPSVTAEMDKHRKRGLNEDEAAYEAYRRFNSKRAKQTLAMQEFEKKREKMEEDLRKLAAKQELLSSQNALLERKEAELLHGKDALWLSEQRMKFRFKK